MKTYLIVTQKDIENDVSGSIETMMNDLEDRGRRVELLVTDPDTEVIVFTDQGVQVVGVKPEKLSFYNNWLNYIQRRFFV